MKTDTNIRTGLTDKEVLKSKQLYGENRISKIEKTSFFKKFLETLGDPIIKILLIALAIKTIFLIKDFDWYEISKNCNSNFLSFIYFQLFQNMEVNNLFKITRRGFKNKMSC